MLLDAATGKLTLADRQRDEAWIGGPGVFTTNNKNLLDNRRNLLVSI